VRVVWKVINYRFQWINHIDGTIRAHSVVVEGEGHIVGVIPTSILSRKLARMTIANQSLEVVIIV